MTLRNVVVMLVLGLLAALAFVSLRDDDSGGERISPVYPAGFVRDDVSRVVLHAHGDTMALRRRTGRSGEWEIELNASAIRADAAAVEDFLGAVARQGVRRKLTVDPAKDDLSGFGLAKPLVWFEAQVAGKPVIVRYGRQPPAASDAVYADGGAGTDVWTVQSGVEQSIVSLVQGGARSKRLTEIRAADLVGVEVSTGGVTTLRTKRNESGIWTMDQPYTGFGEPVAVSNWVSRLLNADVKVWGEPGEVDLKKYGLDAPRAEVILTPRRPAEPATLLLGGPAGEDSVFVMEKGVPIVATVGVRFGDAALADAAGLRDRSFSRLGLAGTTIRMRFDDFSIGFEKAGSSWDIVHPERVPTDDTAVRALISDIQSWQTVEFRDQDRPEDHGIKAGGNRFVEIALSGSGMLTLDIGDEATDGTFWARRRSPEGDGGVERVQGKVIADLREGAARYRRRTVLDFGSFMDSLVRIEREAGTGPDGSALQSVVLTREPPSAKERPWRFDEGPGLPGKIDPDALHGIVSLSLLECDRWVTNETTRGAEFGFSPPKADLLTLTLVFDTAAGTPPFGSRVGILVGKKRPEGGRFAQLGGRADGSPDWVFVLGDDLVRKFSAPIVR